MCLKNEKIGHMENNRKILEANNSQKKKKNLYIKNPKIQKEISKVTPAQSKRLYIPQSINQRKSNFNYKSLSIFNQINFKQLHIHITVKF